MWNIVENIVLPLTPALRPERVAEQNRDDVEGSAVGKRTLLINSAPSFSFFGFSNPLFSAIFDGTFSFCFGFVSLVEAKGDLSINEIQYLQGCFYLTANAIPLFASCHFGNVKRPCSRNILHIFSVWAPVNCNSNELRSQDLLSKLQFPYNSLLYIW